MANKNININWGSNGLTEDSGSGLSDLDFSDPNALEYDSMTTKDSKSKSKRKSKKTTTDNKLRQRQNYQKLDKGNRGYL